jgi:Tfp pilus assembly protein PilO
MNALKLKNWSERQQVLAVIVMAGALLSALWFFILSPQNRRRRALETEVEEMRNRLAQSDYLRDEESLEKQRTAEEAVLKALSQEWNETAERLGTFANQKTLVSTQGRTVIDFKVDLFDVRRRLLAKSRALGIALQHDLGIKDTVLGNEEVRRLMLQLRAVEKIVDLALDLKIQQLSQVEPMAPIEHRPPEKKDTTYIEEYPVRFEFAGTLDDVFELFHAVLEADHVFMLKRFRIRAMDPERNLFSVQAVMSALLFLKEPGELIPPPARKRRRSGAIGL